jgi:hypothetical protein
MRCFFIKGGHIAGVEALPPDVTDDEAIEMAHHLFEERRSEFDGFEVWDHSRELYQFPGSEKATA